MKFSDGSLTHGEMMKMPWVIFCSYIRSMEEMQQTQEDTSYFNGSSKLAQVWNEKKDKWTKEQKLR